MIVTCPNCKNMHEVEIPVSEGAKHAIEMTVVQYLQTVTLGMAACHVDVVTMARKCMEQQIEIPDRELRIGENDTHAKIVSGARS